MGPDFAELALALDHSFDDLVGAGEDRSRDLRYQAWLFVALRDNCR